MFEEAPLPQVSAIVLADRAQLRPCVEALLGSEKVNVEVVLVNDSRVDDGRPGDGVRWLAELPGVTIVAGGIERGVAVATGGYLVLVPAGAVVEPGMLARMVRELARPEVGMAAGTDLVVHVLGLSSAPVAVLATTREHWDRLGGPSRGVVDFAIRTWRLGLLVVAVPDAVAEHLDEPDPGQAERDRLDLLLTLWSARSLLLLAVPLAGLELALTAAAVRRGSLRARLGGWAWLVRNRRGVWARRKALRRELAVPDRVWMRMLTDRLDASLAPLPPGLRGPLNAIVTVWWRLVSRLV